MGRCAGTRGGVVGGSYRKESAMACCIVNDVCRGTPFLEYRIGGGGIPAALLGGGHH